MQSATRSLLASAAIAAAIVVASAAHAQDAGNSDVIVTAEGGVQLLELNTIPGMTPTSLLPKIAAGRGIDYPQLCERILLGARLEA